MQKRGIKQSKEFWLNQRWGKLRLDPNQDIPEDGFSFGNKKRLRFLCDCGRVSISKMNNISTRSRQTEFMSCGKCSWKPKEFWLQQSWGNLRLDPKQPLPDEWAPTSKSKFVFLCECGKTTTAPMAMVHVNSLKYKSSCGKCTSQPLTYWLNKRWGSIRLSPDQKLKEFSPRSNKKFNFLCDCGREFQTILDWVTGGNVVTCGKCFHKPKEFMIEKRWGFLRLDPNQKLPVEMGEHSGKKFKFICNCGETPTIRMADVADGSTMSCGCIKPGTSELSPARAIHTFMAGLAPDAVFSYWFEHKGKRLEYDIYVPSHKLAVEFHGLYWHTEKRVGKKDSEKYKAAVSRGDRLIQIFSDEWEEKPEVIKAQIAGILAPSKGIRIKPSFEITQDYDEVKKFLNDHHYLGAASGCLMIAARFRNQLVGCWVFMKREEGVVLWHRACWNHKYRSWNPHQKALELARPILKDMGFTKIVTFADNRFHTGDLYEKLGFIFEEEIHPDYYYTDGYHKRKSKYALRVPAGVNEKLAAENKGWYRLWDSGKKRFSLAI